MADLIFKLYGEKEFTAENVTSYELTRDVTAPCDGLRLSFISKEELGEIRRVEAYLKGVRIFNGYCDTQREKAAPDGFDVFIYARSTACLLVDNDAQAYTYESPSARGLFIINAEDKGFKFSLEDCSCRGDYTVGKGVSCYSAVNNLVSAIHKRNIVITPDNEMIVPDGSGVLEIKDNKVISEKRIINRGEPISQIDYKTSESTGYSYHFKSRSLDRKGIKRSKKINLSTLPDWQRSFVLKNLMSEAAMDYDSAELALCETVFPQLYDRIDFSGSAFDLTDYRIKSVYCVLDSRGERTIIRLFRENDLEEINYVD